MKIWLVNHYAVAPDQPGGTRHHGLASQLARLGHEPLVIAANLAHDSLSYGSRPQRTTSHEVFGNVPFLWLPVPAYRGRVRRFWNMLVFAFRLYFGHSVRALPPPEVIVGSTLTPFAAFAALRCARRLRVPFVLEVRDLWPQTLIDFGMHRFHPVVLLIGAIERHLYRSASAIVTLLPGAEQHMRDRGAASKEIVWIPNGVDLGIAAQPTQPEPRQTFEVVYTGSHAPGDALSSVLDAALLLQQRGRTDIRFRFIGNGPSKPGLEQQAAEMELRNVSFHPPVAKRDIYQQLAPADALLATLQNINLYRFGTSLNKLYDYMASARSVIFSGQSCNDPVATSGCGFVVPPENPLALADAVEKLAAMSPQARWEMGLRGRRYVEEHHDFKVLAKKLEELLVRVMTTQVQGAAATTTMSSAAGEDAPDTAGEDASATTARPLQQRTKRAIDVMIAVPMLVLLAPIFAVIALAIRMSMGSPVLFRQMRPGKKSVPFTLLKFRTMNDATDSAGNPLPDADRLTRLGKFLRASSLDELPQLWNVIRGELSLVGPRPLLMEYLSLYTPEQARRHDVRPGITGLAQISGRNQLSWEEKLRLDVEYVELWSIWLDLRVLFKSIRAVVLRRGISFQDHATTPRFTGSKVAGVQNG